MFEHITPEELDEAIALSDLGWENCTQKQRTRWHELYLKATFARAKQAVLDRIELERFVNQRREQ